ncbi:hypothetical protein ACGFXC_10510 [Streptomyces sp. NPDC048507]|uniref:hypothetical protein n=1 Tax=Streptomyces sp. NPDC048507 TaxID=3365560 RepID=UPI003714A170
MDITDDGFLSGLQEIDESGLEFWDANKLCCELGDMAWEEFVPAVYRAMAVIRTVWGAHDTIADRQITLHPVKAVTGGLVENYRLTRLGAYLVVMNCDSRRPPVAKMQMYFARKTSATDWLEERAQRDRINPEAVEEFLGEESMAEQLKRVFGK